MNREWWILTAVAAWGLAAGITLATLTVSEPPSGQLPSELSTLHHIDARAPLRSILLVIITPIVAVFVARPFVRRLEDAQPWSVAAIVIALLSGVWIVLLDPYDTLTVLFVPPIAAFVFALLRRREVVFTVVQLPIFLVIFAIAVQWLTVAHAGLVAAAIAMFVRVRSHWTIAYIAYPIFAIALFAGDLTPRVNFFEDGHSLTPASEMLRGERPFRDIVPGHGLISDGLLDWIAMRFGADTVADVLRVRAVAAALLPASVYLLALACTGSAEIGILAFLFAASLTITGTPWARPVSAIAALPGFRPIPSLLSLAAVAHSLRMRSTRWLAIGAVLAVIAELTSIEFGLYAIIVVAVAAFLLRAPVAALAGGAVVAAPAALIMLIRGWLGAYLRTMLFELPLLSTAYSITIFYFPTAYKDLSTFPEILAGLFVSRTVWFVLWCLIAIGTAVLLTRPSNREPILILGVWTVAAALSFAERTNVYFLATAALMLVAVVARIENRTLRLCAIAVLIVMAAPTTRLITLAAALRNRGSVAGYVRYETLPRARGGWFETDNATRLASAQMFIDRALGPSDTFFDFANMPILYYLFNRPCPIRQYETPFYETEKLQRDVIARLEADRSVRAALMQFPNQNAVAIDSVPNSVRAPLVYAYLQSHFRPAYMRDGVVFWMR